MNNLDHIPRAEKLAVKYRTYRHVIVLEVKYRDLQTCDSPGGEV
jgi:hypothetical protein